MKYPVAKVDDFVVKVVVGGTFAGGQFKTATIQQVGSVKDAILKLANSNLEYDLYSGQEINPAIPGFYSEVIAFDGGEVARWKFDN